MHGVKCISEHAGTNIESLEGEFWRSMEICKPHTPPTPGKTNTGSMTLWFKFHVCRTRVWLFCSGCGAARLEAVATQRIPLFVNEFCPPGPAGPTDSRVIVKQIAAWSRETGADRKRRKEVDIVQALCLKALYKRRSKSIISSSSIDPSAGFGGLGFALKAFRLQLFRWRIQLAIASSSSESARQSNSSQPVSALLLGSPAILNITKKTSKSWNC